MCFTHRQQGAGSVLESQGGLGHTGEAPAAVQPGGPQPPTGCGPLRERQRGPGVQTLAARLRGLLQRLCNHSESLLEWAADPIHSSKPEAPGGPHCGHGHPGPHCGADGWSTHRDPHTVGPERPWQPEASPEEPADTTEGKQVWPCTGCAPQARLYLQLPCKPAVLGGVVEVQIIEEVPLQALLLLLVTHTTEEQRLMVWGHGHREARPRSGLGPRRINPGPCPLACWRRGNTGLGGAAAGTAGIARPQ